MLAELRQVRDQQAEYRRLLGNTYEDGDLVFAQFNGRPLHGHNITRRDLQRVIKAAGLPRLRFHDLRHLFATHNLQRGEHLKVVSEILGHADVGTTLDLYSHVLPGLKAQVITAMGDRLLGAAETSEAPR